VVRNVPSVELLLLTVVVLGCLFLRIIFLCILCLGRFSSVVVSLIAWWNVSVGEGSSSSYGSMWF